MYLVLAQSGIHDAGYLFVIILYVLFLFLKYNISK